MRIKLLLSYDGTDYCGWQKQKEHKHASEKPNLQETVEKALGKIFNEPIKLSASGRTDAGVHALAQIAHFDTKRQLPKDLCWALKAKLPLDIVAKKAWVAPDEFHSTLSAEKKTYRYWVWNNQRPTALLNRYSYWVRKPLDLDFLNNCSKYMIGQKDFKSFQSVGTELKHTVRTIYRAEWTVRKNGMVQFEISGNGFLKQMVRNVVGTQIDLLLQGKTPEKMLEIIAVEDRKKAGSAAPPQGLFLYKVYYPNQLDNRCRQI